VRDELVFYATGARPDIAQQLGFIGGKMPLQHGPAEGEEGLKNNLAKLEDMRNKVGEDFWLMFDCWMSLDLNYATRLAQGAHRFGLKWVEECLSPDDYWGYAELRKNVPRGMLVTTGEHEATRWGFRMLLEMGCCDIIQPDVNWCGGITELIKISALADAHGALMVPHGSGRSTTSRRLRHFLGGCRWMAYQQEPTQTLAISATTHPRAPWSSTTAPSATGMASSASADSTHDGADRAPRRQLPGHDRTHLITRRRCDDRASPTPDSRDLRQSGAGGTSLRCAGE
jgi:Enolase C-terminal domain-like